jgi:hypothetical protein
VRGRKDTLKHVRGYRVRQEAAAHVTALFDHPVDRGPLLGRERAV